MIAISKAVFENESQEAKVLAIDFDVMDSEGVLDFKILVDSVFDFIGSLVVIGLLSFTETLFPGPTLGTLTLFFLVLVFGLFAILFFKHYF